LAVILIRKEERAGMKSTVSDRLLPDKGYGRRIVVLHRVL
jgi:hypothetical protein